MLQVQSQSGFTVLEVVVAVAILAVSLTVLFSAISESLLNMANVEALTRGEMLVQSLLSGVGSEFPVQQTDTTGVTPDGLRWRLRIEPYTPAMTGQAPVGIYHVVAEVVLNGQSRQTVTLSTLRLGPRETRR